MRLIEVVILAGSHCLSPLQGGEGITEAAKVQCAVLVRHDEATGRVTFSPPEAATDPQVIAMLVSAPGPLSLEDDGTEGGPPGAEGDGAGTASTVIAKTQDSLAKSTADDEPAAEVVPKAKPRKQVAEAAPRKRKVTARKAPDRCGSYKAVWYTKNGHKRYRCVKTG